MAGFRFSIRTAFYLFSATAVLCVLIGAAVRGNGLVALGLLGGVAMIPALMLLHAAVYLMVCSAGRLLGSLAGNNRSPEVPGSGGTP